jgi:hypothetical protein
MANLYTLSSGLFYKDYLSDKVTMIVLDYLEILGIIVDMSLGGGF